VKLKELEGTNDQLKQEIKAREHEIFELQGDLKVLFEESKTNLKKIISNQTESRENQ
jgi:hypothetical protein